jgi:hypothetical protein
LDDWIHTNFDQSKSTCTLGRGSCGKVHTGFQKAYNVIMAPIQAQIRALLDRNYHVIISGHSKGSAMAILATYDTVAKLPAMKDNISYFGFGTPRVGDKTFVKAFDNAVGTSELYRARWKGIIFSTNDIVTSVPLEIQGFSQVKGLRYVRCQKKYFSNPLAIPDVVFPLPGGIIAKLLPTGISCHFHQVYMDGVVNEQISVEAFEDSESAPAQLDYELENLSTFAAETKDLPSCISQCEQIYELKVITCKKVCSTAHK